jgi:hypothetical protein
MAPRPEPGTPSVYLARVQQLLRERAKRHGLHVGFGVGRRGTDVTLLVVKGERLDVLRYLPDLVDDLGLDQEVVRSSQTPDGFELMVALMRPKPERPTLADERRASHLVDPEP